MQLEQTFVADSGEDLGDGLYAILGNDSDEQDFMFYYGELFADYKVSTTHAGTDVPYSPYVSSALELDNGQILIDSGMKGLFGQYNEYGDLLAQFKMTLNSAYIYRVYKYNFSGFYFA